MNLKDNLKKRNELVRFALELQKFAKATHRRKEKYKNICSSLKRKSHEREKSYKAKIEDISNKLRLEKKKNEELTNEILDYKSILWKVSTGSMERKNKLLEFENSELKKINDERGRKLEHLENNIKKEMKKNKKARETMYLTSRRGYHDSPPSPSSPSRSSSIDYYRRKRNKRIASGSPVKKFKYFSPRIMRKTRSVDNYSERKWKEQGWGVMKKDERQRKKLEYNIDASVVKKKKSSSFRKNTRIELRESDQFSRSNSIRSNSRSPNSTKIGNKIRKADVEEANIKKDVSETVDKEEEEIEGEEVEEIKVVKKVKEEKDEDLLEEIQLQSEIEKEIINIEKTIDLPAEADLSKTIEEVEEAYESEEKEEESCKEIVVDEERKILEKHEKDNEDSIFQEDNIHNKVSEEQEDENSDAFAEIVDDSTDHVVSEDGSISKEKEDFVDDEKLIEIGEESEGEEGEKDVFEKVGEKFIKESEVRKEEVKEGMEEGAKENENFKEINSLYSSVDNSEEEEFADNFGINLEDIEKELKDESENEKFYGSENSGSFQDLDELVDEVKSEEEGEEDDDKEDKDEEEKITFHKAVSESFEDDILVLEGNDDVEENKEKSNNNSDSNSKEEEFDFMKDSDDGNSDIIMLNSRSSVGDGETSEFKFLDELDSLVL